jgi:hypothetical protein
MKGNNGGWISWQPLLFTNNPKPEGCEEIICIWTKARTGEAEIKKGRIEFHILPTANRNSDLIGYRGVFVKYCGVDSCGRDSFCECTNIRVGLTYPIPDLNCDTAGACKYV